MSLKSITVTNQLTNNFFQGQHYDKEVTLNLTSLKIKESNGILIYRRQSKKMHKQNTE